MKQIEGIDLNQELEAVRAERLAVQREIVRKSIRALYAEVHRHITDAEQAEAAAKKAREKATAAQTKLDKLMTGDWSVLKEEQDQ